MKHAKNKKEQIFLLSLILVQIFMFNFYAIYREYLNDPYNAPHHAQNVKINDYVKNTEGLALVEDTGFLVVNNKPVLYEPFQFRYLQLYNLWDNTQLIEDCNNKKFSLVVAGFDIENLWGMSECLYENYTLREKLPYYGIWDYIKIYTVNAEDVKNEQEGEEENGVSDN